MKMRKKLYVFLLSFTMLGMVGCTTEHTNTTITPTSVVQAESSDIKQTVIPTTTPKEEATPTPAKSSTTFSTNTKEKEIIIKTDGLCEALEKVDDSQQVTYATYNSFNRMLSNNMDKGAIFGDSLFCVDDSTGVIYFVNQNKDYYLYRIKDEEVRLAVAMPVKELYAYDGSIYFMLDSCYDKSKSSDKYELKDMHSGDIYRYTPIDGKVELVYEAGAIENSKNHRLTVEESGIYFYCEVVEAEKTKYNFYHLPFGATEPIQDTKLTAMKGWKEYVFSFVPDVVLESRVIKKGEPIERLELPISKHCFCVVGNTLYSAEGTYISCINLETQEEMRYDFLEAMKENISEESLEDKHNLIVESFVITETDVWVASPMILYRFNLESKEVSYCRLSKGDTPFYEIETLYTDGKELYATCLLEKDKAYLAHIQTDKVELTEAKERIMILDFLTE